MPRTQQISGITKTIGIPIRKEATSRTPKDTLIVRGYFTSDAKDMHGDIITRSATERAIEQYRQWGNIRRMHQPDPVGKMLGIGEADGLAWNEIKLEVIDPKAVFEVENGLLQALSIGAAIQWDDITWLEDGGMLISDYLLGEISLVDHPGNYDAILSTDTANAVMNVLVKRYGIDVVGETMLSILEETDMTKEIENEIEDVATDEIEDADAEEELMSEDGEETSSDTDPETVEEKAVDGGMDDVDESLVEGEVDNLSIEDDVTDDEPDTLEDEDPQDKLEQLSVLITNVAKNLAEVKALLEGRDAVYAEITEDQEADMDDSVESPTLPEDAHKSVVPATTDVVADQEATKKDSGTRLRRALEARFSRN